MKTFFSIVIPTYNSSQTLGECIKSLINQNYTNFEILIIDGLSNDKTLEIANSFNDNRIKIYSEKDSGIYDAMNKGIAKSIGEWLIFLGSDDSLHDNFVLNKINIALENENYDVLYGNVISPRFTGVYDGEFDNNKILTKNICHQAIFFRKSVFLKVGRFNTKYKAQADWDHNMRWFFSDQIRHKYFDIIVSNYSDGGFSSQGDWSFENLRIIKYLLYSRKVLPIKIKLFLLTSELKRGIKQNNKTLIVTIFINFFKILLS